MVRWARRGDGNSYGDSGAPNIDEMEEKRVSGLDKEELGINLTLVLACGLLGPRRISTNVT